MDNRRIAQLAQVMSAHDLTELSVETADVKLVMRRGRVAEAVVAAAAPAVMAMPAVGVPAPAAAAAAPATPAAAITSPIVGTFYLAPSPDAQPFVKPGDKVGPETVVCIVEAMKVMNEVKAEVSGVIRRVLVENGTPVEFGQPLFEIDPA
ncbi:MAG: acetyl-CoA carboxylase biotin carboxyl carrier protein [Lentisphaerae bacterium]|nr:acetyl-CoA carboxylase biotin carboxyl carrier protein [Lentisphaerota bacterium]